MMLIGAERFAQGQEVADDQTVHRMKTFKKDITFRSGDTRGATQLLPALESL